MPAEQNKNDKESPVAPDVKRVQGEDSTADKDQNKNKIATQSETDLELADEFQATDN